METAVKRQSPLLELPGELRNSIYRFVLTDEKHMSLNEESVTTRLALLGTRRQVRSEAAEIFYAENHFVIAASTDRMNAIMDAIRWLQNLGPQIGMIRHLRIEFELPPRQLHWLQRIHEATTNGDSYETLKCQTQLNRYQAGLSLRVSEWSSPLAALLRLKFEQSELVVGWSPVVLHGIPVEMGNFMLRGLIRRLKDRLKHDGVVWEC